MVQSKKRKSPSWKLPNLFTGRFPVDIAQGMTDGELKIGVQFELTIDEGNDPVSDDTVDAIQQEAGSILEEGGQDIIDTAREIVPVRTGALRASIYSEVEDVTGLTIGATMPYASFVEYGTPRMPPRPFLSPAIDTYQPMIQEDLDQMIAEQLANDSSEDDPEYAFDTELNMEGGF